MSATTSIRTFFFVVNHNRLAKTHRPLKEYTPAWLEKQSRVDIQEAYRKITGLNLNTLQILLFYLLLYILYILKIKY